MWTALGKFLYIFIFVLQKLRSRGEKETLHFKITVFVQWGKEDGMEVLVQIWFCPNDKS